MGLQYLGLDAEQERVYRALLPLTDARVAELADAVSLPEGRVLRTLDRLVELGLAQGRGGGRYTATSPDVALGPALAGQRTAVQLAEQALAELVDIYRSSTLGHAERELIEVVAGTDAVRHRYLQLQLGARSRIDTFVTGSHQAVSHDNTEEATVMARGIRARAVIDRDFLTGPAAVPNVEESLGAGVEVRTTGQIPLKLIIFDGSIAMLPVQGRGTGVDPSLVLRGGPAQLAQSLFDTVWQHARPYGTTSDELDPIDRRILQLLLAGFTDGAASSQLELSLRTVQRRISALMERAGVTSRVQLGWHAREHGWS